MRDLGSTILCCTPSYAAYIGESLEDAGYKPEDNKLKAGIFGAEPWTEEMRREIEKYKAKEAAGIADSILDKADMIGGLRVAAVKLEGLNGDALRQMGFRVECTEKEGFLPVQIQGGVPTKRTVQVDPLLSSQFVSALLLAAPKMPDGISLTMTQRPTSRPYIEMTCDALLQAGVEVRCSSNGRTYYVQPFQGKAKPASITIERDWSAASYFYTMAVLRPDLRIRLLGLQLDSCQGDSATDRFFRQLGVVSTEVRSPYRAASRSITIQGGGEKAKAVQFNCLDCPDLVPTFAVAAAAAGLRTVLKGVSNIALKESDRREAITTELRRMGVTVNSTDEEMHILPSKIKPSGMVRTYGDHRIAMAFAPLRLLFPDLEIENPEVVGKSFPEFWEEFDKVLAAK